MKSFFSVCFLFLMGLSSVASARGVKEGGGDTSFFETCVNEHLTKIQSELMRDDLTLELSSDENILYVVTITGEVLGRVDISVCHQ
ncbi:hypothetical protein ACES2I_03090 [Bdellovibrio bacteriovorus]|uniref:hypothetical protein n=1 Tax=Bdellovibrio bacteriovorus TaxID=959 RepID=UPI0035A5818D